MNILYRPSIMITGHALFVTYGPEGSPSHSVWLIPGTWED